MSILPPTKRTIEASCSGYTYLKPIANIKLTANIKPIDNLIINFAVKCVKITAIKNARKVIIKDK